MSKKAWSEFWNLFYAWKKIVSIQHRTASTVHKMQGSQTDKIFVLMDGFKGVDAQPLLYTAVTRGRKELHFVKT
jgi:ATP-dependent exoDNAse (exonuclease V) alpha subunit